MKLKNKLQLGTFFISILMLTACGGGGGGTDSSPNPVTPAVTPPVTPAVTTPVTPGVTPIVTPAVTTPVSQAVTPPVTSTGNPPAKPSLTNKYANYNGAGFVKLHKETGAYTDAVTRVNVVKLPVSWTSYGGAPATSWQVLVDGTVKAQGSGSGGRTTVDINSGGEKQIIVRACNSDGCTDSTPDKVIIADTDGSHLRPLTSHVLLGNKEYVQTNKIVGAYFVEWGIYARKYFVENIPAKNVTHLIYGFIPICGANQSLKDANPNGWRTLQADCEKSKDGELVIHDMGAALYRQNGQEKAIKLDGTRVGYGELGAGNFGHLMALKKANPNLEILPSIGGWTLTDPFFKMTTKANRDTFVASAKEFLETWKFFDGLDIDWEFPGGGGANSKLGDPINDGPAYVALMKELRAMLDELGIEKHRTYELTSAVAMGYDKIEKVDYAEASKYLDYIFMMTYDFYGAWENKTGHQTGLYCGSTISAAKCNGTGEFIRKPEYTAANGVQILLNQGVPANKLVLGATQYGRSWVGVEPGSNNPISPMGSLGTGGTLKNQANFAWEDGIMDYRGALKFMANNPSAKMIWDDTAKADYIYDQPTKTLITLDTPRSVAEKGLYIKEKGLAGIFSWELDGDGNGDILNAMNEAVGNKVRTTSKNNN